MAPFLILSFHPYSRTHSFFSFHLIAGCCQRRRCFNNVLYCVISFYGCAIIFFLFSFVPFSLSLALGIHSYALIWLNSHFHYRIHAHFLFYSLVHSMWPLSSLLFFSFTCKQPHSQTHTITQTIFCFVLFLFYFALLCNNGLSLFWLFFCVCLGLCVCLCDSFVSFHSFCMAALCILICLFLLVLLLVFSLLCV